MKKILVLMIVCVFSLNACNDVKEEIRTPTVELSSNNESAKIQQLVQEMKNQNLNVYQTRKINWDRIFGVLYADAKGYCWGRQQNFSWQLSLVCSAVFSVIACIDMNEVIISGPESNECEIGIKDDYRVSTDEPLDKPGLAGAIHNESIV